MKNKPSDKFTWQIGDVEWLEPKGKTVANDAGGLPAANLPSAQVDGRKNAGVRGRKDRGKL